MNLKEEITEKLPKFYIDMIVNEYGEDTANKIIEGYCLQRKVTFRTNTLKTNSEIIAQKLKEVGIKFEKVSWYDDAFILEDVMEKDIQSMDIYKNGEIYLQSLSSMLPPIILEPKEKMDILDMAAAPGGKTTQIVALSNNNANITACEINKIRLERLKYNLEKQGATSVYVMNKDARDIDDFFSFDKILLDTPCSGSGTLNIENENLKKSFTIELINKSVKIQVELLRKAIKLLKPNKEMVYSTCSILKEENEYILQRALKGTNVKIIPIELKNKESLPLLPTKIDGTITVCPNEYYEGFFVAKLKKEK